MMLQVHGESDDDPDCVKEYDKANVAEVHSDSELAIATSCFFAADY